MRHVVSSALILLYSVFILANLYVVFMGGLSVTRGIFLVLSVLVIIALTGKGGSNSQFWAYVLCGLLGFAGAILFGYSVWAYTRNLPIRSVVMWAGPILVLLAATTYWAIKLRNSAAAPEESLEVELYRLCRGDKEMMERLISHEQKKREGRTHAAAMRAAIESAKRDNG